MRPTSLLLSAALLALIALPANAQWQRASSANLGSTGRIHVHEGIIFNYGDQYRSSSDGGATWTDVRANMPSGDDIDSIFTFDGVLMAHGKRSLYRSEDAGLTWSGVAGFLIQRGGTIKGFAIDGETLYLYSDRRAVFYTSDGGATFTEADVPMGNSNMEDFAAVGDTWAAVIGNGGVMFSFDAGQNWLFGPGAIWQVHGHGETIFGTTSLNGLHRLAPGASDFEEMSNGLDRAGRWKNWSSVVSVGTAAIARGTTFPGSNQEIYLTLDQGDSWTAIDLTGAPGVNATSQELAVHASNDVLWIYNYQRNVPDNTGVFKMSLPAGTATEAPSLDVPGEVAVLDAYPNPFLESVTLDLGSSRGTAIADVFDLQGRLVRSLTLSPAGHAVWDGRDSAGEKTTAGIYFIRGMDSGRSFQTMVHRLK